MVEPDRDVKDADGWTWHKEPEGWGLPTRPQLVCYHGIKWEKLEREYGPMREINGEY